MSSYKALVPPVLDRGHHLALCRAVAGQLICDHHTRGPHLPLQQLPEQALGGPFVPSALDQDVEHAPVLIDGPPQPVLFPLISKHTSSRCHLSTGQGSLRRIWLAKPWPNL